MDVKMLLLMFLLTEIKLGECIDCYYCLYKDLQRPTEDEMEYCYKNPKEYSGTCLGNAISCFTATKRDKYAFRGCLKDENFCEKLKIEAPGSKCFKCSTDLCNGVSYIQSGAALNLLWCTVLLALHILVN